MYKITYIYIITRIYYTTWICGALWNLDPRIHHRSKLATSSPPTACHGRFSQGEHVIFSVPKTNKSHIDSWILRTGLLVGFCFSSFFGVAVSINSLGFSWKTLAQVSLAVSRPLRSMSQSIKLLISRMMSEHVWNILATCSAVSPKKMAHFTVICKLRSKAICIWDRLGCLSLHLCGWNSIFQRQCSKPCTRDLWLSEHRPLT